MASQDLLNLVGESETESTVDVSDANGDILSDSVQDTGAAGQLSGQKLLAFEDDTFSPSVQTFAANSWVTNPSQDPESLGDSPGGHLCDLLNLDLDTSVPSKRSVVVENQSVVFNIFDQNILVNDYHEDQKQPVLAAATNLQLGDESSDESLGIFKSMEDVSTDKPNSVNIDLRGGFAVADSGFQTQDIDQPSIQAEGNVASGGFFDDFSMLLPESDQSGNLVSKPVKGSMSTLTNETENNQMTEADDGIVRFLDSLEPANFESMATPSSTQHDQTPISSEQNILDIFGVSENRNNETPLTINAQGTGGTDMKAKDSFSPTPSLHVTGDLLSNSIILEDVRDPGRTTNAAAKHEDLLGMQGVFEDGMASNGPEEHSGSSKTDLSFLSDQPSFLQLQQELPEDKSIPESDDSKEASRTDKRSDCELLVSANESIPIISSQKLTETHGILNLPDDPDCCEETKSATIQKDPQMDSSNHIVLGEGKSNATREDKECLHEENSHHLDLISPETNDQKNDSGPDSDQKQTSEILPAEENVSFVVGTLGVYGLEQDSEDSLKEAQTVIQKSPGGASTSPIFENKEESSTQPMRDGDMDVFRFSGQKMNATPDGERNVFKEASQILDLVPTTEKDQDRTGSIDIWSANESMGVVDETESNVDEDSENYSKTNTASAFINANVLLDQISEIQVDEEAKPSSACYSQASLSALEGVDPFRVTTSSDSLEFLGEPLTFSDQLQSGDSPSRELGKAPPTENFLDASGQTEFLVGTEGAILFGEENSNIVQTTLKEDDGCFDFQEEQETSSGMTDITGTDGIEHEYAEQEQRQPSELNENDFSQQPTSSAAARGMGQTLVQSESGALQDPVDSQSERLMNEPHLKLKPGKCDSEATNADEVQQQVAQKLMEPDATTWEGGLQTDVISNDTGNKEEQRVEDLLTELQKPETVDSTVHGSHQTFQTVVSELLQSVYKSAAKELNLYDGEGDLQVCEVEMKTETSVSSDIVDENLLRIGTEKEDSPSSEEANASDNDNEAETQMDTNIDTGFISNVTETKATATQPQLNLLSQSDFGDSSTLPEGVKLNAPDSSDLDQVIDSIVPLNWSQHTSSGAPLVHEDALVTTNVAEPKHDKHSDDSDCVILIRAPNDTAASDSTSIVADNLSKSLKADAGIVDREACDFTLVNLPQESYDSDQPATSDNKTDSVELMMPRGQELEESSTLQLFEVLITPDKGDFPAQSNFESKLDSDTRNVAKALNNASPNDPAKSKPADGVSVLEQDTLLKSAAFDSDQTMNPSVGNGATNHDTNEKAGGGIPIASNQASDLFVTVDGKQPDQKFEHYDRLKLQDGICDEDEDFLLISDSEVLSATEADTGTLGILVSQLAKEADVDEQDLSSTDEQRSDETKQFEAFSSDQIDMIDMNSELKDPVVCKESGTERISEANSLSEATLRKHGDTQDLEQVSHPETDAVNAVVSETYLSNDKDTDEKPIPLPDEIVPTSMLLEEFLETESDGSSTTSLLDSLEDGFDVNNNVAAMADDATIFNLIRELVDNIIFESVSANSSSEEVKAADPVLIGDKLYVGIEDDADDQGMNALTINDDSFHGIVTQGIAQVIPKDGNISNDKGEAVPDCNSITQHEPGATQQQAQDEVKGFSVETEQHKRVTAHVEKLSYHHGAVDDSAPTKQSSPPMIPTRKKKKKTTHLDSEMEPAPCRSPLDHEAEITEDDANGLVEIPDYGDITYQSCADTIVSSAKVESVSKTDGSALMLHDTSERLSMQLDEFDNSVVDQGSASGDAEEEHETAHNALSNDYISNYEPASSGPVNNLYPDVTQKNIKLEDDCLSPLSEPEERDDVQALVAVQCASHGVSVEGASHTMLKEDQVLPSLSTDNMLETPVSMQMGEGHSESSKPNHTGPLEDCSGLSEDATIEKYTSGSPLLNFSTLHDESVETMLELPCSNISGEKPGINLDIFGIPGLSDASQSTGTHAANDISEGVVDEQTLKSQLVNQVSCTANRSGFSCDTLPTEDNVPLLTGNQNTGCSDNKSDVPLKIHPDPIQDLKGGVVNSFINNDEAAANMGSIDGNNFSQVPEPITLDDTESRNLKNQTASFLAMSEKEDRDEVGQMSEAFEVNEALADADPCSEFANVGIDDLVPEKLGYDDTEGKGSHSQQDFDHKELNNGNTGTESFQKISSDPFYVQSSAVMEFDDDELYPNTSSFDTQKSSIASGVIKKVLTPRAQTYTATSSHYVPVTGFSSTVPSSVFIDKDLISDNEDDEGSNHGNVTSSSEDEKEDSAIGDGIFTDENEYDNRFLQSFPAVNARVFPVVTSPYDQSSQYDQSAPDVPNYTYQAYDVDWEELLMQAPPRFPNLPAIMEESEPSDTEESQRKYPMIPMNYDPSEDHSKDDDNTSLEDVQCDQEHCDVIGGLQENDDSCIAPSISDTSVKDKYLGEHVTDVHPIPKKIISPEVNECENADYSSSTENAEAVSTLNEHSVDSPLLEALSGNIAQNVVVEDFVSAFKKQEEQLDSSLNSDENEEHIYLVSKGKEMEANVSAFNSDDEDQIFASSIKTSNTDVLVNAQTESTIEEKCEVYVKNVENQDENEAQTMLEGSVDALEPANDQLSDEELPSRYILEQYGAAENVFQATDADSSFAHLSSNSSANKPFENMEVETAVTTMEETQNEIPISEDQLNSNVSDLPISSSIDIDQQKEDAAVLLPLKNSIELVFDVSNPNDGISPNESNPQVSKSEDIGEIPVAETVLTVPPSPPKRRKPKLKNIEDSDVAKPLTEENDVAAPPPPPVRKKKKTLNVQNDVELISAPNESQIRPRVHVDESELEHKRMGEIQSVIVQGASRNNESSDSFEMPTSTTSFQEPLTENFSLSETAEVVIISSDKDPGSVSSASFTQENQVKCPNEALEVILPVFLQVDKTNEPADEDRLVGKTDTVWAKPSLVEHLAVKPEIDTGSSDDNYDDKELELIHTIAKPGKLLPDDSFQNDDQTPNSTSHIPTVNQSKTEILLAETSHAATSAQTESDDLALKVEQPLIDSSTPGTALIVEGLAIVMIANGNKTGELEVIDKETADDSTSEGPLSDDSIQESSDEEDMTDRVIHTYNIMAQEVVDHLLEEVIKLAEDQTLKEEKLGNASIFEELVSDILTEVCYNLHEKKILSEYDSETKICAVETDSDILTVDKLGTQSKEKSIVPLSITSGSEEIPEVSETPIVANQVNNDAMEMLETPRTPYQIPLRDQNDDYNGSEGILEVSKGPIVADQFENDNTEMLETPQTPYQIPLRDEDDDYKPVGDGSEGIPEMSEGPIVADQFDNDNTEMLVAPQTPYQIPLRDEDDDYKPVVPLKTRRKRYDTTGSIGSLRYLTDSEEEDDESLQPAIQSQRPETLICLVDDAVVDDDTPTSLKTPELEFSALDDDHPHLRKSLIPPSSLVLSVALDDIDLTEKENNQSDIAETPLSSRLSFSSSVMGSQTSLASSTEDGSGSKRSKLPSLPMLRPRKPSEPTEPVIVRTKLELLAQENIIPIVTKPESRRFVKWEIVTIKNIDYRIDETAIQPYKKVVAHGGFYSEKSAIIEIFTSYLPPSNTEHYAWVMDNLFLYVLATVELLALEKFSVVLFVGSTPKNQIPANSLLKKWHEHVDYRLKKNVEAFYIVSPTFYFRTMARLFVSRKVMKKMKYVKNMAELKKFIPTDFLFVPPEIAK